MRILITGSRNWDDTRTIRRVLTDLDTRYTNHLARTHGIPNPPTLVHGDCPTGADHIAAHIATELGWNIEPHPAHWLTKDRSAGPVRNQEMVNLGADECHAFPLPDSRGTYDCIRRAERAGIPTTIHTPHTHKHQWTPYQTGLVHGAQCLQCGETQID